MTVPVVLHVDGLCMSLTLGCSTFLDLSETNPQVYFGVRYFIEGMLSFGGMNSPAIYNLPASYLILLAHEDSKLDKRLSIQQLGRLSINYIFIVLIKTGI